MYHKAKQQKWVVPTFRYIYTHTYILIHIYSYIFTHTGYHKIIQLVTVLFTQSYPICVCVYVSMQTLLANQMFVLYTCKSCPTVGELASSLMEGMFEYKIFKNLNVNPIFLLKTDHGGSTSQVISTTHVFSKYINCSCLLLKKIRFNLYFSIPQLLSCLLIQVLVNL